jgi:catechol 2,3-dioxygenase-like lactoylglutathione lyase family enzyme
MDRQDAPQLAGVHHLKLPVTDLARSREWYRSRLGYQVQMERGTLNGSGGRLHGLAEMRC